MDLNLPDLRGDEVVRTARAAGLNTPIVMLAAETTPAIRVRTLDQGADDLVTAFCDLDELLCSVPAAVRCGLGHARSVLRAGNVEVSLDRREASTLGDRGAVCLQRVA